MKKYIVMIILCITSISYANAGDGDSYISLSNGLMYKNTYNATLSFEKFTSYHNSFSIDLDYSLDFSKVEKFRTVIVDNAETGIPDTLNTSYFNRKYEMLTLGFSYKKVLRRYKNGTLRGFIGAGVGMNSNNFTAVIPIGFEYTYTFKNRCQFFIQEKNQVIFWGRDWLRVGGSIGFRVPF